MLDNRIFSEEVEKRAIEAIYNYGHSNQRALDTLDFNPDKVFNRLIS